MLTISRMHLEINNPLSIVLAVLGLSSYAIVVTSNVFGMDDDLRIYLNALKPLFLIFGLIMIGLHVLMMIAITILLSRVNELGKLLTVSFIVCKNIVDMSLLFYNASNLLEEDTTVFMTILSIGLIFVFVNFFLLDQVYFSKTQSLSTDFGFVFICSGNMNCLVMVCGICIKGIVWILTEISASSIILFTTSIVILICYGFIRRKISMDTLRTMDIASTADKS